MSIEISLDELGVVALVSEEESKDIEPEKVEAEQDKRITSKVEEV